MDKDNMNSEFDFDNPEFSANFYKNIEKALGEQEAPADQSARTSAMKAKEESTSTTEKPTTIEATNEAVTAEEAHKSNIDLSSKENTNTSDDAKASKNAVAMQPSPEESAASQNMNEATAATSAVDDLAAAASPLQETAEDNVEEELFQINSSLAQQISVELDNIGAEAKAQRKKLLFRIQSGVALAILCLVGFGYFLGFTEPGNNLLMGMGINLGGTIWASMTGNFKDTTVVADDIDYVEQEDVEAEGEEIDPSTIVWPNVTDMGRQEDGVYNILLLGEEAIGSGDARGRTDVIVIATLNTNTKKILLTSLMRDTLVQIPGFKENKLNVAYEEGGIDLLYTTIAYNFDIHLDGCVMVNFENFEKIIDRLGGLEITLTAGEAKYLNTTNYISNRAYRNVVEGTQLMNGNQVLGYARVRKRANINGTNNDYGRTERHRIILNAIFEKYKTTSKTELLSMMFEFLPMITTDIDSKNFEALLNAFVDMGMGSMEIEQLRIPADGAFQDNVKVRGMSVLIPDLNANIQVLHSFIFGDSTVQNADTTSENTTTTDNTTETGSTETTGTTDGSGN